MVIGTKVCVFLVAGNRVLREALARLLSKWGDFDVCGLSPSVPEVPSSIASLATDVLVLDSITVQLSDYALIPEIVKQAPNAKIVLIDMEDDPEVFSGMCARGCCRVSAKRRLLGRRVARGSRVPNRIWRGLTGR
jgi:DNA-binding NarL/FixJ family response regulator